MYRTLQTRFTSVMRWMGMLLLSHLLLVTAMAASPALHHHVHHDSEEESHECAVMIMATGNMDSPDVVPVFVGLVRLVEALELAPQCGWVPNLFLENGPLERGPPARS